MKRRDFFKASAAAGVGLSMAGQSESSAQQRQDQSLVELRRYHFASRAKLEAFEKAFGAAIIPELNRLGVKPVGMFEIPVEDNPDQEDAGKVLYILMQHPTAASVATMLDRLVGNLYLYGESERVFSAPKSDPAFTALESSLFLSFEGVPRVEVPTEAEDRLMQLRIYQSHNTERALKKIEMFNTGGELKIFRDCAMNPVFFGQALIGGQLPNLTYMLGFDSSEAMKTAWGKFGEHPDWKSISRDPQYADTVSKITNLILRPTQASQI